MNNLEKIKAARDHIPFVQACVAAGFPSPAQDYVEDEINLHDLLVPHPLSSFVVKSINNSMTPLIPENALLVVDKALTPKNGDIIVGFLNGDFTLKRFVTSAGKLLLRPENRQYPDIVITEQQNFAVWGVVTQIIIDPNKVK